MTVFWKCPVVDFAEFVRLSKLLVRHKFAESIGGTLYNRSSTFSIISVSTSKIRSHHFPLPGFGFSLSRRLGDGVEGGRTKKQILLKFLWKELRDYRKLLQLISNRLPDKPQFKQKTPRGLIPAESFCIFIICYQTISASLNAFANCSLMPSA